MSLQRIQLRRQRRVIRGDIFDILVGERGRKSFHDRIATAAVLVFVQHLLDVFVVLAGQARVLRIDGIAVGAVAGETGGGLGLAVCGVAGGGSALPDASAIPGLRPGLTEPAFQAGRVPCARHWTDSSIQSDDIRA